MASRLPNLSGFQWEMYIYGSLGTWKIQSQNLILAEELFDALIVHLAHKCHLSGAK